LPAVLGFRGGGERRKTEVSGPITKDSLEKRISDESNEGDGGPQRKKKKKKIGKRMKIPSARPIVKHQLC